MKRVIYADDLISAVRDDPNINGANFARIKRHIEEAPDAVKNGHWVIHSNGKGANATNWAECSECHVCGSPQWKVCPVCEARMDGGAEDGN